MVTLFRKRGKVEIDLPTGWQIASTIFKEGANGGESMLELVRRGLDRPVDGRPLESLVKAGARVAIVVDDLTRPTPVADILPVLLERLHGCGVKEGDVDIVIGVGTHRPLTPVEIGDRCGQKIASTYRCRNHDCRASDLAMAGEVAGLGPVFLNRTVASADVRIAVGSILPHPHNGFGGGPKNVMPGICDFDTIRKHHLKNVVDPRSILGNLRENPFYEECCRIAELARMDFSVSCIYDSLGRVCDIVAGDMFAVHRAGVEKTKASLGVPVSQTTDVTLVSSYPYDEGPQIVKPVLPAAMVTNPGGTIFLLADDVGPPAGVLPGQFFNTPGVRQCRWGGAHQAETGVCRADHRGADGFQYGDNPDLLRRLEVPYRAGGGPGASRCGAAHGL